MINRLPMFGFFLLCFLLLAVVLAAAVWFVLRGAKQGGSRVSGPAGCAIGCALLAIAGLGALGLLAVALVAAPAEMARRGPFKNLEFEWGRPFEVHPLPVDPGPPMVQSALRLRLELRGAADVGQVARWLRRKTDSELPIAVEEWTQDGERRSVLTVTFPLGDEARRDLERLERDLRRDLPELQLPSGVKVELRSERD